MKRSVVNRYYREIIEALNECEIRWSPRPRIKKERVAVGGWYSEGVITIRNRPGENWVLSLIHEALHHRYPNVPEYDCDGEMIDLFSCRLFCEFSAQQLETLRIYIPPEVLNGKRKKRCQKPVKKRKHPPTKKRR